MQPPPPQPSGASYPDVLQLPRWPMAMLVAGTRRNQRHRTRPSASHAKNPHSYASGTYRRAELPKDMIAPGIPRTGMSHHQSMAHTARCTPEREMPFPNHTQCHKTQHAIQQSAASLKTKKK